MEQELNMGFDFRAFLEQLHEEGFIESDHDIDFIINHEKPIVPPLMGAMIKMYEALANTRGDLYAMEEEQEWN